VCAALTFVALKARERCCASVASAPPLLISRAWRIWAAAILIGAVWPSSGSRAYAILTSWLLGDAALRALALLELRPAIAPVLKPRPLLELLALLKLTLLRLTLLKLTLLASSPLVTIPRGGSALTIAPSVGGSALLPAPIVAARAGTFDAARAVLFTPPLPAAQIPVALEPGVALIPP
jgi:hypothetical protein